MAQCMKVMGQEEEEEQKGPRRYRQQRIPSPSPEGNASPKAAQNRRKNREQGVPLDQEEAQPEQENALGSKASTQKEEEVSNMTNLVGNGGQEIK